MLDSWRDTATRAAIVAYTAGAEPVLARARERDWTVVSVERVWERAFA